MRPALPWFLKETKSLGEVSPRVTAPFGLVFLGIGLFLLWSESLQPTLNWMRARSWQPVNAVIETAQIKTIHRSKGSPSYEWDVQFSYPYDGTAHTGTFYRFVRGSMSLDFTGMQQVVAGLPPGKKVIAWANPQNPAEAVLDRSWPPETVSSLFFATPFIAFGMAGLFFSVLPLLRRRFRARRQAQLAGLVATGRLPPWILRPFQAQKNDVALVTAADERLTQLLIWLFFNLFWNSLVGVFVWTALVHIVHGEVGNELFAYLILTPFVAVGILLLWMLMKSWRCQRRSQWVAAVHPVPGFGGGTVKCCWAWLEDSRCLHAPQALVRVVTQAAHWNRISNSPAFRTGGIRRKKLLSPGICRKGQRELGGVEIPILCAVGEIRVTLPRMPSLPAETAKQPRWMAPPTWCRWWQLEVTYRDGGIELCDLTQAKKVPTKHGVERGTRLRARKI